MSNDFTPAQRFVIWQYYDHRCYYCEQPVGFPEVTIDHVLPKRLSDFPIELAEAIKAFGLPGTFRIDDYCNWLPCHFHCNTAKGSKTPRVTPRNTEILHRCVSNAEAVRSRVEKFKKEPEKAALITQFQIGIESGTITKEDLKAILAQVEKQSDQDYEALVTEIHFHLNSDKWNLVGIRGDIATVTNGRLAGITPVNEAPHYSWQCPHCSSYGPWNGTRCMSCGMISDPAD